MDVAVAELIVEIRQADGRTRLEITRSLAAQIRLRDHPLPAEVIAELLGALRAPPAAAVNDVAVRLSKNAPRTPRPLLEWPSAVVELAAEVRAASMKLKAAQCQRDFAAAQVASRKLRALTVGLERAKLAALALPDVATEGKPRMVGQLAVRSRFAGSM
jgi:hypothetical protein